MQHRFDYLIVGCAIYCMESSATVTPKAMRAMSMRATSVR